MEQLLKSMTGFGRHEVVCGDRKVCVELKSVNHRYLDLSIKMPKKFNEYESFIRSTLKEYINRGKVDVYLTYEDHSLETVRPQYNQNMAKAYMDIFRQMEEEFELKNDITVSRLASLPEVLTMEQVEANEEVLKGMIEEAVRQAAEKFIQTRIVEGEKLKVDLIAKLDKMLEWVAEIEKRSPEVVAEYRQRITDKVKELLGDNTIDENRILTEVTIFSDKICVDEETVRLKAHIETMRDSLIQGGSVGRNLDFIAQEMNREANTTLSKSNDVETSNIAILLKTEVEKVREQIQNIE
ncbi:Protein YicC [Lachnospiraceae bacterium TWA4]|nr:Protein YicC [Lachnospiraceae bacterium TWA4]